MTPSARRSIKQKAAVSGTGLHTGARTEATFLPAPAGQGIVFRRVDLAGKPEVAARLSEVEAVERRTAIGKGASTIHTVEHVLAAVAAHEIDDVTVELSGPEPPILDGSVEPYFAALAQAGPTETSGEPVILTVPAPFTVTDGDSSYVVAPARELRLTVTIEWPHPLIGRQSGSFTVTPQTFGAELARARTFGFTSEIEGLKAKGLIKGASAANAILLDERGLANGAQLRWPDEFLRHKTADIVGDLALTGARIRAHVVAERPSHSGNIALARALARAARRTGAPKMDIGRIMDVLPHRYPFLLVDRIIEVEGQQRIVGIKNVTINEPFFQGHFPGHPIMPGVLIIEAMAQVGGMLLMGYFEGQNVEDKVVYFMSLDNVKFRRPVVPGDQIRFELEMLQFRGKTCRMKGVGYVDGQVVAEADMMATVVDR
ncbi:MAG TPA: bifunctional UDP-3-O-[3-hydroxymyristoyl] N-acetylglucosamine deacetylase/3-hydroxyacyl-ACP dehydratase [Gemmatimonadales bacterium]|jgi:UDP-3-O-[3-hydroxymyristoyl] N-acetylglucosamine deacetylase / 3-hydroxyacyl-[acyl-carrier-protein] dehydratase|nr:bifunctional UDP-3-O-[3-hydroxymyristoyl] N-acetylglucosamine deacetylase/3-hydroxyacyl-ACP dehydratase [Gemmatimonadales bacterium]